MLEQEGMDRKEVLKEEDNGKKEILVIKSTGDWNGGKEQRKNEQSNQRVTKDKSPTGPDQMRSNNSFTLSFL